ncbi:MAG: MBL fold metallo-hydrolase [Anaerolineae bacterium]|nr:MBL fold metallo-hydrolase [Anaerolineae bacterium]
MDSITRQTTEFIVLGCRAGSPGEGSAASGYLIRHNGRTILLDCGPGVVMELTRLGFADHLDAVLISHAHADHCADLVALAYQRLFPVPKPPLPLWGAAPVQQVLDALDAVFSIPTLPALAHPLSRAFAFMPIPTAAPFAVADLLVEATPTVHPTLTFALRFAELGLVYTADAALTDELAAFAHGAALLVSECTYPSADGHDLNGHGHMSATHAGQLGARAQAQRLLLTHFSALSEAALSAHIAAEQYSGEIILAHPSLRVSF